jgi:hypothetical protein
MAASAQVIEQPRWTQVRSHEFWPKSARLGPAERPPADAANGDTFAAPTDDRSFRKYLTCGTKRRAEPCVVAVPAGHREFGSAACRHNW